MDNNKKIPTLGILNINKPRGLTSFDVVAKLRRVTGIKQIGHTGTLDPFATGVLPICIGKATKLIEYLPDDKAYLATVQFGKNTDTYDLEGEVTQIFNKKVTQNEIMAELDNFMGEISQYPPIYSAIKVNGKKLYDYARKGENVEIKPRKVTIYKIELREFDVVTQQAKIYVECSKGTYIRSIAYDLGKNLSCGGYLIALERTLAGKFSIENSVELDNLKNPDDVKKNLVNPLEVLDNPIHNLSENELKRVSCGMAISNKEFKNSDIVFLVYGGRIHAIGMVVNDKILVKKVFEVL
ncbi:tRNA pseudouridine(55) synthase TruB [bacterium]|nr:tRNA pseudouridine(55) synthase TruB [bacterium]